jgi:hypothetical protein
MNMFKLIMQKRERKGLSTIIVTLILILVSLVAVGIIWVVVRNIIQTGTEGVGLSQFSLSAKILDVSVDNSSNNVSLTVKRNAGEGELEGISFVFSSGENNEVITRNVSLKELEQMKFYFHLINTSVSDLISVSIVPLIRQDEKQITGIALDKYNFGNSKNYIPGQTTCTPTNCSILGYVCGTWNNGTCAGTLNCGNCTGGQICNASGRCVSSCVPATCAGLGYQCGSGYANGTCSGTLNCGNCSGGQICNSSGRCVSSGTTVYALSCSQTDVQAAINNASNGDTIIVPAGNCIWGDGGRVLISGNYAYPSIHINKSLKLSGLSPTITGTGTGYFIYYSPYNFSKNFAWRITGFTLDGGGTRSGIYFGYSSSDLTIQDKIRIDHNTFRNMAEQAIIINGYRGVADNNIFTGTDYSLRFASGDDYDWWQNWEGLVFGKADNNFYFEDNVINTGEVLTDCQYGNRYAFRYNTITASAPNSYPLIDMHGDVGTTSGGCAYRSCFGSEMYGNHITLNSGYSDFRGGKHLVFDNYVSKTGNFWGLRDSEGESLGWEACDCVYCSTNNSQPQHISDSYAWNNRGGSLSGTISPFFSRGFKDCTAQCGYVVNENDEYFNYNPSFDGTTGIGCGTLANRPITCTTGVGYWATTQSCTDLTGLVGDINTNPTRQTISGILYKCTSPNTWTLYYQPYTYPHPLTLIP